MAFVCNTLFLYTPPVPPNITSSYLTSPDPCLGYSVIISDNGSPVTLTANVTADPCPSAVWTLNGTEVTDSTPGISVSGWYWLQVDYNCYTIKHVYVITISTLTFIPLIHVIVFGRCILYTCLAYH